jgi:hypothetical protein
VTQVYGGEHVFERFCIRASSINGVMRDKSGIAGPYDKAKIYASAKRSDGEIARIVIEQHTSNTSGVVAFPSGHDHILLEVRPLRQARA